MKNYTEVINNLDVVQFNYVKDLSDRIYWCGAISDCLQVRVLKGVTPTHPDSSYEFAMDVFLSKDGDIIVTSTVGNTWGYNLKHCIKNVIEHCNNYNGLHLDPGYAIVILDDSQNIYEENAPKHIIKDKAVIAKLTEGIEQITF